jgi:hypothetical protein
MASLQRLAILFSRRQQWSARESTASVTREWIT